MDIGARDPKLVTATPTKEFFIYMLTKDIPLIRAIADLVDNCIDGARRLRGDERFDGLTVRIEYDRSHFKIADNCGGIDTETARKYAFRFGRAEDAPDTSHSIGQFGVGMKRALFKLGKIIHIESTTEKTWFSMNLDVSKWAQDKDAWDLEFDDYSDNRDSTDPKEIGTIISVTELLEPIANEFIIEKFQTSLAYELEAAHQLSLDKGLVMSLNGLPLRFKPSNFLTSDELKPASADFTYKIGNSEIKVKIMAGIAKSDPSNAGWYIFCNGRLVLEADRSTVTGWGEGVPFYHNQYARFRGYVVFDSDNANALPWNTTKSGVDADSAIYRAVRLQMITLMRPVIDFLNSLDAEKDIRETEDPDSLDSKLNKAGTVSLSDVNPSPVFVAPAAKPPTVPTVQTSKIQYYRNKSDVEKAKKVLKVASYREVGEKTFDIFFENECEE